MFSPFRRRLSQLTGSKLRTSLPIIILGTIITLTTFWTVHVRARHALHDRFESFAAVDVRTVNQQLNHMARELSILSRACAIAEELEQDEFERLAAVVGDAKGIKTIAWAKYNRGTRNDPLASDPDRQLPLLTIGNDSSAEVSPNYAGPVLPLLFTLPREASRRLRGIDLSTNPTMQAGVVNAYRTGEPTVTDLSDLSEATDQACESCLWLAAPVFFLDSSQTPGHRSLGNLKGFLLAQADASCLLSEVVRQTPESAFPVHVVDETNPAGRRTIYRWWPRNDMTAVQQLTAWLYPTPPQMECPISFAGRNFLVKVTCSPQQVRAFYPVFHWLILPSGLLLSVLLAAYLSVLKYQRQKAEELMWQRTAEVRLDEARLESLSRISRYQAKSVQELLNYALLEAVALTQSKTGQIYLYDDVREEFTLASCCPNDTFQDELNERITVFTLENSGHWGQVIREVQPITIDNQREGESVSEGGGPWSRFLAVPVVEGAQIVAVVGVADKDLLYSKFDVRQLTLLADFTWGIVARKQAELALKQSEERFRTQFMNIPIPTFVWQQDDSDLFLTDYNEAALTFTKGKIAWLVGAKATQMYDDMPEVVSDMRKCLAQRDVVHRETPYTMRTTGERKYLALKYAFVPPDLVMLHMDDITSQKQAEEELRFISHHDSLTGLFNRLYSETEIERMAASRKFPIGVIVVDVDQLKEVNDRQGHAAGDQLLRETGRLLKQTFRPEDMVARTGGDEFLIILPEVSETTLRQLVQRLRSNIGRFNVSRDSQHLSVSIGATVALSHDELQDSIRHADRLMYQEKTAHRLSRVRISPGMRR